MIVGLAEEVDDLEDVALTTGSGELRSQLSDLRRQIISLRRFLAPQRDAMLRLQTERSPWLLEHHRIQIRETADTATRYLEELDAARERVSVAHEELISRLSEQLDQRMYVLSIITTIFLPLGLITGLLGINVGGIPGSEERAAFAIVCGILVVVAIGLAVGLRRLRMF